MKHSKRNTQRTGKRVIGVFSLFIFLSVSAITATVQGQTPYKVSTGSQVTVSGTSNLHDWSMLATTFACDGTLIMKGSQLQDISTLSFSLPVTNLKSKETLMDTRAYKALKSAEFSKISFKLTEASIISGQKTINAKGKLTIAGVTNEISIQTVYSVQDDGSITISGSKPIKMSYYNMKAPSFMLGALKTGNVVTIDILLKLKKSTLITQTN